MKQTGQSVTGVDRKSTRLNSSHTLISYAVFCLKKKKKHRSTDTSWRLGLLHRNGDWNRFARLRFRSLRIRLRTVHTASYRMLFFVFFFLRIRRPPRSPPFPYTTLFRSKSTRLNSSHTLISYAVFCWSSDVCSRSEEHTSELQSHSHLVCRLLLEKKT